jgi:peroxiredoxin
MTMRGSLAGLLLCVMLLGFPLASVAGEGVKPIAPGDKVPNGNSLRDLRGNRRPLHDFKGHSAVVLAFLGAECPVSNLYLPGLLDLEKKYRARNVQFLAVYPQESEDLDQVAAHSHDRDVPFPVLKDFGHRLTDRLGVSRLPTVVVLDKEFGLCYRGRIDDRYGASARRPKATREDLVQALEEVLAGKKVTLAETEADGCLLTPAVGKPAKTNLTYTKDVAPILQNRCQTCHRKGQAAPFSLVSYENAVKHASMIKEVTAQRRMPPWHADPRYGKFANDRRLSDAEVATLTAWVDGGMARGDDKDLPKPIEWSPDWIHGKPDLVISMPEEFEVPADGVLDYKNWIIDTNFTEDKWVRVAEGRPGTPSVVHHIVVYIMEKGQTGPIGRDGRISILVGWAPGDLGLVCPPDTALRIPKGSRLRFEMHYTPNGTKMKDRSSVGLTFAKKPPRNELVIHEFANTTFEVPPGDPHFKAQATFRFRADARIISFAPHMHWRGKDYHYDLITADGKRQTLLSVPRWDFNWQNVYRFEEAVKVTKGSRLHAVAHWDNSANNPLNPDPKKSVRFGLQTWDEMMVGFVAYVWERPETLEEMAKNPLSQADRFFDELDVNGDEILTPDELPTRLRTLLWASGVKMPDKVTREEFKVLFEEMRKRFKPKKPEEKKPEEKKPAEKKEEKKPGG